MRTKEITVELKLLAQPKQYHSLSVSVSATVQVDDYENTTNLLQPALADLRKQLSDALTEGIYEEIKKHYGGPAARMVLAGYFASGGKEVA